MNNKLKKLTCVALATVMAFSGMQVQTEKVQASTATEMDTEEENEKTAVSFTVELSEERTILEGNVPENTDVKITNVSFEDGSKEEVVSDISQVFVSLENGYVYKLGENVLYVTYMGCTQTITVSTKVDQVVSMSAIQSNHAICDGDTLRKSDFDVVAYYASGKIDSNYIDYEIVDTVVTETTKSATLRNPNGVEIVVDITLAPLEPKSMVVSYSGVTVKEGCQVEKDNFEVILIYNNGKESILEQDEYDLIYDEIVGNRFNAVEVVYKANTDICDTVYVWGESEMEVVIPTPATTPAITDDGNKETQNPESTPEITMEPEHTTSVPTTTQPAETPSVTATVTPSAIASQPPSAEVSATPVVDNSNASAGQVTTGAAVTTETAIPATEAPDVIKNSKTSITLGVGETVKITMDGAETVTYETSNSKILTVTKNGVVTAKKVGKAKIVATDEKGNTKTCTITVKKAPKKVKVNFTKKTMKKGKKATIKVSFAKGYYSNKNTFKSSNKKVATVNSKGVITAKKKGTCKITVKTFNGKKAVIKIIVK